ncbi:MAG: hypothetical protein JNK23_03650 [Opitutaceae bacterium]|nr:hypothetical protein [Opitutaceae bacterium]
MSNIPPPLPADERRRATATTEAFIFQWWLSVSAWLELGDDEALYLESSEDFEVTTSNAATTTQAKAGLSRSLTLRSEEVTEALNHYWELTTHEKRTVRFVLLARAEAGVEQGAPLGEGIAGIKLWQEVALSRQPQAIERLQRFLHEDSHVVSKLVPGVRDFLRTASATEFFARLVQPITFDLGREPSGDVQQLVRNRLVVLAEDRHGASVAEAERIADTLFSNVVHVAAAHERVPLTRAQLLRLLEEHIVNYRERVGLALPRAAAPGACPGGALWEAPSDELNLPPLPVQLLQRPELVVKLRGHLAATPVLVLFGSTGMGKTTLAKQVAGSMAGSWWWLDLQGCPGPAAQVSFRRVLSIADRHRGVPFNLVLDGFSPEGLTTAALHQLRAIALLVRARDGQIIITAQRPLTATEIAGLGWIDITPITAPRMEADEITRFATELGCTDPKRAAVWGTAVHLHTDGHPQLVHAACLWLQQNGWPKFDGQTFRDSATTIESERAQARRLVARLSSEELELLTRLSVMGSTFRRDQALALAEKLERLQGAAFRFDSLLGPWIEPGDASGYHRLSPLLDDSTATLSPARRADLEVACAVARLENAPVYVHDAARALQHAVDAPNALLAADIAAKFLLTPQRQRGQTYVHLLWLTGVAEAELEKKFSGKPIQASFIHLLRFQVAAELLPTHVAPFIAAAERSLTHLPSELTPGMRFAFLSEVLLICAKQVQPRDLLRYVDEAAALASQLAPEADVSGWFPRAMLPPMLRTVPLQEHARISLVGMLLVNLKGRQFLDALMESLAALPDERRRPLLRAFGAWPTRFFLSWDKTWLDESEKASPDWESLLAWLAAAGATAKQWNSEEIAVAVARAASVICNEYLNDQNRAERALEGLTATTPGLLAALFDQRAMIAAQRKQYAEAVATIREAFPRWDESDYGVHGKMLALQRAGVWAGKLERWKESAEFFAQGADFARKAKQVVRQAGLETDAGVALWRANEKKTAVDAFARAIELCSQMRPFTEDLATFQFQKLLGHILLSLAATARSPSSPPQAPIVPGMASESVVNEKVKTMPPPQLTACKVFVAMLEHNHQLGETYWARYREDVLNSRSISTRRFAVELAIRKAVARGALGDLPALAAQHASIFAVVQKLAAKLDEAPVDDSDFPPVSSPFDDQVSGYFIYLAGLASVAAHREDLAAALQDIEANADKSPYPRELRQWAQRARGIITAPEAELTSLSRSGDSLERLVAAVTVLSQVKLVPESLWGALYVVASSLNAMYWGMDVMRPLDQLAGQRWREAAENRFAFRNPTLWLPDLKSICGEPVTGSKRVAGLLLAALPALDLKLDANIVQQLKQMRDDTLDTGWRTLAPRIAGT